MLARIFWILFSVEATLFVGLMIWAFSGAARWGPEGPVGAWLIVVVPPLMLGIPVAIFLIGKSDAAKMVAIFFLALPLLQAAFGPLYSSFQDRQTRLRVEGDSMFSTPAQRELAHAIRAHNAELAKALIPKAGDLNAPGRAGDSMFRFCMTNLDKSEASFDIVKAMLASGANPKLEMAGGNWPLAWAINTTPELTELLLNAGANPNSLDSGKPVWWEALEGTHSDEKFRTLQLLLDHGADVNVRYYDNGPVGWATNRKNWQSVWLMIQHGAAWEGELSFGTPILRELLFDLESRRGSGTAIPEELPKLISMYESVQQAQ